MLSIVIQVYAEFVNAFYGSKSFYYSSYNNITYNKTIILRGLCKVLEIRIAVWFEWK